MNNNLANSLSDEQKAVALTALKWISLWVTMEVCDNNEMLPKCAEKLNSNYRLLNFSTANSLLNKYEVDNGEGILFSTLDSIPTFAKSWFVVETYMMVSADGNITPRAMQIALMYCEKIGISEQTYLEIIKQAYVATGDSLPGK